VHHASLLHRDIKAQNVMRETTGRIVLMDFGTGHDPAEIPARPGDLSGTPLYCAPEILAGERASVASDVYALAVVMFHLLTGAYPVTGDTIDELRRAHRDGRRTALRELRPDLRAGVVAAIERGLSADPALRFRDASEFELALGRDAIRRRRLLTAV